MNKHNLVRKRDRCSKLDIKVKDDFYVVERVCPKCKCVIETKSKDRVIACRNHFNRINGQSLCKPCSLELQVGGWKSSAVTIAGNSLNSTVDIGPQSFEPNGISMFTRNVIQNGTPGTSSTQDIICMGTASSSTSRNSGGVFDENNLADSDVNLILQYDSVLSVPSAVAGIQAEYDISSFSINNIRIITDVAGSVASTFLGYLAFGTEIRSPRPVSIGHPFII